MPSWSQVLVILPFLSETTAVVGLTGTSALLVLLYDWRLSLLILLLQYILANVLLIHFIPAEIALFKFIIGAMVCTVLFLSVRRAEAEATAPRSTRWKGGVRVWAHHEVFSVGLPFRLLTVVLLGLVVHTLLQRSPLQGVPPHLNFAIYWLGLVGLLIMMLSARPWKVGLGLLTFLTAFELYYVTLERGLFVTAMLGVLQMTIVLSLGYLIMMRAESLRKGVAADE